MFNPVTLQWPNDSQTFTEWRWTEGGREEGEEEVEVESSKQF